MGHGDADEREPERRAGGVHGNEAGKGIGIRNAHSAGSGNARGGAGDGGGTDDGRRGTDREADAGKAALRGELLAERALLSPDDRVSAASALAERALAMPEVAAAGTVAAYVSVGREPGTRALLDALRARGVRVILPVLMHDNDLDWAAYEGDQRLARAARGLLEPTGDRLGPGAVLDAGVVLVPGLAVDRRGMRLGRGGGSYDRVLARLAAAGASPVLAVLLYDGEVVARVPVERHDRPVDAAVTPRGVHRFEGAAG